MESDAGFTMKTNVHVIAIEQYFQAWQFSRPHFIASYLLLMASIYYPLLELSPTSIGITFSNFDPQFAIFGIHSIFFPCIANNEINYSPSLS